MKQPKVKTKPNVLVNNQADISLNMSDSWTYYDRLNFIPVEEKDECWAAKALVFIKQHSQPFQDPEQAKIIRERMRGNIDILYHKKRIDPEKSEAKYFSADWKACPIDQHLDEIIETTIKQIPVNLGVKAVDEYSISKKQADNRKILNRSLMLNLLNSFNTQLGFPLLKKTDDPFAYIQQMQMQVAQAQQGQQAAQAPGAPSPQQIAGRKKQIPPDVLQSLLAQIDSSELLGIYNEFLHKEGVEIACELGMDYYLNVKNKFVFNHAGNHLRDIKGFGKACGRLFTSDTTGTPVYEYFRPEDIYISDYSKRDISDHIHWFHEKEISYGDFMRRFGAELGADQLRAIFELNRKWNGLTTVYEQCGIIVRNNAMIRVGYVEWESQDMEVYADYEMKGNAAYKKMPTDFVPGYKTDKGKTVKDSTIQNSVRDESHYNVWYKCYYIPYYFTNPQVATLDFPEQAKYIFKFGKLQDQERYGDDERFARSSLVGCYSDRLTWFEIKDSIMKEINHLWLLFQNDLSNVMPNGLNWAYDLIVQMTSTVDDANANNKNAVNEWAAKVKQTGSAITKLLKDENGRPVGNVPPFTDLKSNMLAGAMEKLDAILVLYQFLVKALGQNELSDGEAPKPRTNLGSIQLALGTSGKASFYVEEMYTDMVSCIGNKMLKYFKDIVDDGDSERLQEFEDIVGQANMTALKEIKDIPMRNLGLYVENVMTKDQKDMVMQIAQSMASAGTLDIATGLFLTLIDNLKQAYAILVFKKDQMDKKLLAQEQAQQQYQMDMADKTLQNKLAEIQAQGQIKQQLEALIINLETKLEETVINLKGHWTVAGKEQIKQNRIEQDITASQIDKLNTPGQDDAVPLRKDMPVAS